MGVLVPIAGTTQSYDWGKLGDSSKVAVLSAATPGFSADPATPYAELWMGTHPNGPSVVLENNVPTVPLKSLLTPETLGEAVHKEFEGDLPFLFKVLSIRKALSIQAHPDKKLAADLFAKFPKIYKDPNHKPEMALALTPFEAFIGFRPLSEIAAFLSSYPELAAAVTPTAAAAFTASPSKETLQALFKALMTAADTDIQSHLSTLTTRLAEANRSTPFAEGSIEEMVLRLDSQYPGGDVGVFAAFLLNYVKLSPGDAIFLAANEPHAYLSGDCVECMAASDNVVRSGLTPKFKDVDTLTSMLTYRFGPADSQILKGEPYPNSKHSKLYDPPIAEFAVVRTELVAPLTEHFDAVDGPSVVIVTQGDVVLTSGEKDLKGGVGGVFFVGAGTEVSVAAVKGSTAVLFRAFCTV